MTFSELGLAPEIARAVLEKGYEAPTPIQERTIPLLLAGCPAHEIVRLGISHVPEGRIVFANLSVEDNLELGAYLRKDRAGIVADRKKIYALFPRLEERRRTLASV